MSKYNILTDKVNTYFTNNKITIAASKPTIGTWEKGDIVISSSPTSLFGWICTAAGTPGTWMDLNTASDLSHNHNSQYYTKNEIDKKITSHTHSYLPLSGGTVTGETVFSQGTRIHSAEGTAGSTGYVNIAQISVTGTYANQPFTFTFTQRGNGTTSRVHLAFTPTDTTDPAIDNFNVEGPGDVYIRKSATSTWQLYIKKTEGYDRIDILDFNKGKYAAGLKVTWKNALVSSVPSGFITAETRAYHKHRLMDLHMIDSDGKPVGNSSTTPIGTTYVRNSSKEHAARYSCYHNEDTKTDYTTIGLYNLSSKSNTTYINLYPSYVYTNKALHSGEEYIQLSGKKLYMKSSSPGAIGAGNVWIKCG